MRTIVQILTLALFATSASGTAAEPKTDTASAPIECYQLAWGSKDNPGLGLNAGQAVELCSGATDANKVIQCFTKAWAHPDDDGLGLTAGGAVRLCKENSLSVDGIP